MKSTLKENLEIYLQPTWFIDCDAPEVSGFAGDVCRGETKAIGKAIRLFYFVRDEIYYDPYHIDIRRDAFKASAVLTKQSGFCVPKALLLAALARAEGLPSRLGFSNVRNHLLPKRLMQLVKNNIIYFHGYTELFLEGKWVKATPTFNKSLCAYLGVNPIEFDGRNDAIFQQYDPAGNRHMQYLHSYGQFADLPYEELTEVLKKHYYMLISKTQ